MLELLTMGRAAVDLYGDQLGASLEDSSSFSKYVGGCPANIAIGASRLGIKCGMITRVGDEAMGRFVRRTLKEEGVEVEFVRTDPHRLTGLVLLGVDPPDHFPLIFYRENCADMAIEAGDFGAEAFDKTRCLLVTGTHFSRPETAAVSLQAVRWAKAAGCRVVVDVDYRPVLWGVAGHGEGESRYVATRRVAAALGPVLDVADLVVGTEEELCIAAGVQEVEEAVTCLRRRSALVRKRGEKGCLVYPPQGEVIEGQAFPVKVLNVLGAGDAFLAGFLRGWLRGEDWTVCASWGNACGALVVTRHGCAPAMPYWEELQAFLAHQGGLDHRHFCLGRASLPKESPLCVLAFDHREYFEEREPDSVAGFKALVWEALKEASIAGTKGAILDHRYGEALIPLALREGVWTAACLDEDEGFRLKSWPKALTVKFLAKECQPRREVRMMEACRQWGHELLLELVLSPDEVLEAVREYYRSGVCPDWWKLPPCADSLFWQELEGLVKAEDPYCRGVLLLGGGGSLESLEETLRLHSRYEVVKGFAVGRTLWEGAAQSWWSGQETREEMKETIKKGYAGLAKAMGREVLV